MLKLLAISELTVHYTWRTEPVYLIFEQSICTIIQYSNNSIHCSFCFYASEITGDDCGTMKRKTARILSSRRGPVYLSWIGAVILHELGEFSICLSLPEAAKRHH